MFKEAMLYRKLSGGRVECFLCGHHCRIEPDGFGFCRVRQNKKGTLKSLVYAKAVAASADPIEKKPFYHFLPGSFSYSVAAAGCNFRCRFCQNWQISQLNEKEPVIAGQNLEPAAIATKALERGCKSISYTYTEPTVFFEYAFDAASLAKEKGLYNCFVTNGYMTGQALDKISPYLDAANVDLKSFNDDFYQKVCRGRLKPVLDTIIHIKKLGIWLEVTTLVIPGLNDSEKELSRIAGFLAGISRDIPWHISRFCPAYQQIDTHPTPGQTLRLAYQVGKEAGLNYVYLGNIGQEESTYCLSCQKKVIKRLAFGVSEIKLKKGKCLFCSTPIAGVFD